MNIEDIARECGVSISTVSRALNNEPGISAETRKRVMRIAGEHNFTLQARKRAMTRSNLSLVVVVPEEEEMSVNPFFNIAELLGAINGAFASEKKRVEIVTPDDFSAHLDAGASAPDGVLIAYRLIDDRARSRLIEQGIPYIFLSRTVQFDNHVSCNFYKGMLGLAAMLAAQGHRRIGYLGNRTNPNNIDRHRGYHTALREAGISPGDELTRMLDSILDVDRDTAAFFIERECDAVMCFNDYMAIQLIRELAAAGKKVPQNISVTGFDDSPLGRVFSPAITTVQMPAYEMAFLASRWLRDNILNRKHQELRIEVDGRIIIRESARLAKETRDAG